MRFTPRLIVIHASVLARNVAVRHAAVPSFQQLQTNAPSVSCAHDPSNIVSWMHHYASVEDERLIGRGAECERSRPDRYFFRIDSVVVSGTGVHIEKHSILQIGEHLVRRYVAQ